MKAQQAFLQIRNQLEQAGVPDASFDADALFAHVAGVSRFAVEDVTDGQWQKLRLLGKRRAQREPLQYILGSWPFLDLELAVGRGVLSPRQETEEVCLAAAELLRQSGCTEPNILDLCSGSGALALGLQSLFPEARVQAVELYEEAFYYLNKNIASFAAAGTKAPQAVHADALLYYKDLKPKSLDLLVANPPYVTLGEYEELAPEVLAEPRSALVAPQQGLAFYHAIARYYGKCLRTGGYLVFEIGANQGGALEKILAENGWGNVHILRDLAGHNRIATAQWVES